MTMGGMARKTALMRDKGDKLVKTVQELAAGESGSTKTHLEAVAECFAALEDYRQAQVIVLFILSEILVYVYNNACSWTD